MLFIVAFNFQHNPPSGWYQQFMPDLGGQPISDMCFTDSLTGYAVTGRRTPNQTNFILKTTNGGDNWSIIKSELRDYSRVKFLNNDTGFVSGGLNQTTPVIYKTMDGGITWNNLNPPMTLYFDDMTVLNADTIYLADQNGFDGGVFRTTNGGSNWIRTANFGGVNPDKIYMYNGSLGFVSRGSQPLRRTTDGGFNWHQIELAGGFNHMVFADSLMGWKINVAQRPHITTNGGLNWTSQDIPVLDPPYMSVSLHGLKLINKDTLWICGPIIRVNQSYKGFLYKTTNSGQDWGIQIPDSNINIAGYSMIDFVDSKKGWVYTSTTGIRTTVGGNDTIFYLSVNQIGTEIPVKFKLHQNYPNPFNSVTKINYDLQINSIVKLSVFDITGKEIKIFNAGKQTPGKYEYTFNASGLSTGAYFYRIELITGKDTFSETKKMLFIQ